MSAVAIVVVAQQLKANQEDPCKVKGRVVGDVTHCDRYWECVNNQPELYDCPNGLVFAGKHRGVTEGCDYPWRANYCDGKQLATTEQLCIGGLLYNENAHSCDWPENVDGCQKHPLCNDDANGNVPLGKSCNRYWQCQGGYPRLQRCPAMLVFDRHSLRCVVPPTEECDIPTTPLPLDGEIENNVNGGGQLAKDEQERKVSTVKLKSNRRATGKGNPQFVYIFIYMCIYTHTYR
uniref:Chitin-binding type-2 domain-containing protein n=1 Tax=Glossina palpalis gambiensis TaxID=67801 RepID=A0A1B0AQL5_9MUSC